MTLDECASSLITDYKETLTNFNLVESDTNNSILAGKPAYKLVYILMSKMILIINDGNWNYNWR